MSKNITDFYLKLWFVLRKTGSLTACANELGLHRSTLNSWLTSQCLPTRASIAKLNWLVHKLQEAEETQDA